MRKRGLEDAWIAWIGRLGSALAGVVVCAVQVQEARAANLFTNADMEDCPALPHNTPPATWGNSSTSLGTDCNFWATGADPGIHAGTRSPRIQLGHFEGITQTVATALGQTYWVSVQIAGNGGFAEIRYNGYDGTVITSVPITASYTLVTGSFVAASATTTIYLGANLTASATGDARLDDACVATSLAQCGGAAPACGDGTVDAGEVCDDGNTVSGDGCNATCSSDESCGNRVVDDGERCDDGNTASGDGCRADCASDESCGNGLVDVAAGEACDDGNTVDGDGCQRSCRLPACGDAILDPAEVCDDGNTASGDGCDAQCGSDETCGNGVLDVATGEACDDANPVDGDGCEADCTPSPPIEGGGCTCRTTGGAGDATSGWGWVVTVLGVAALGRRRRRRRTGGPAVTRRRCRAR